MLLCFSYVIASDYLQNNNTEEQQIPSSQLAHLMMAG
jgi:hypothetical protein